ncbi:TnsA-like heteromeric transposase endonuclease subunit [Streptomyces sp. KR55]|uniref:TnsA-like heteromeric transposase endonuclease subunit n=1 Tax=Streptomyces sp. KR55 TaxID=3457425 RepID=UPI003FD434D0
MPWRTFRWRDGQMHYSGTCWSSTIRDHVVYESRLELTRLLYADFDKDVTAVFAQPFLLSTTVDGRRRRHVPDFLVLREKGVPLADRHGLTPLFWGHVCPYREVRLDMRSRLHIDGVDGDGMS